MELRITQTRSLIHSSERQRRTVAALGLRRIRHSVVHTDSPSLRGMLDQVRHLVEVTEVEPTA